MGILFGHPTGNPNSQQAAFAHYERGRLVEFCIPWAPTAAELFFLQSIPGMRPLAARLRRRSFAPLLEAPFVQGRAREWVRMARRLITPHYRSERLAYEANDWLMNTMARHCRRHSVSSVHSYEDCSLSQFVEAKRLGKACIYDMLIGYYPAWLEIERVLLARFAEWLPSRGLLNKRFVRPDQKRQEMELADIVLVPSKFVAGSITRFVDKPLKIASYGVDTAYWTPVQTRPEQQFTFLYVGQLSIRKGTPLLLEAWKRADLKDARLRLVGSWHLSKQKRMELTATCEYVAPLSPQALKAEYKAADVFLLPTFFEGQALVGGEALASGLPLITTEASGWPEDIAPSAGWIFKSGDQDALIGIMRWASTHRDLVAEMATSARTKALQYSWEKYRLDVSEAIAPYC